VSTVSEKGQITIPLEVRRSLGIKPRDKVTFTLEDGCVRLAPAVSSLEASFQAIPPLDRPLTDKEITEEAAREHVRHVAREGE